MEKKVSQMCSQLNMRITLLKKMSKGENGIYMWVFGRLRLNHQFFLLLGGLWKTRFRLERNWQKEGSGWIVAFVVCVGRKRKLRLTFSAHAEWLG